MLESPKPHDTTKKNENGAAVQDGVKHAKLRFVGQAFGGIAEEYLKQMNEGLITLQDLLDFKCKEATGKTLEEMKIEKEETVEVTVPQDIFNMIGFRGANSYMRKLVVNASLGFNVHLFEEFKSFCVDNKHYSNPNRRIDDITRQIDKMILVWKQSFCL